MENAHKQSSFKNACIHHPPSSFAAGNHHHHHRHNSSRWRTGGGQLTTTTSAGHHYRPSNTVAARHHRHDNDDQLLLQSTTTRQKRHLTSGHGQHQGNSVRELDSNRNNRMRCGGGIDDECDEDENAEEDVDDDLFNLKSNRLDFALERDNLMRFRSMSNFYDSIPDYNDIHHLSETEFYSRLERLKIQQRELMDLVVDGNSSGSEEKTTEQQQSKCVDPPPQQSRLINDDLEKTVAIGEDEDDDECQSLSPKLRPASSNNKAKKSVRISSGTTYRTTDLSDCGGDEEGGEEFEFGGEDRLRLNVTQHQHQNATRSKSVSPRRTSTTNTNTVPRPFKMTQREEEQKMFDDLLKSKAYLKKISIDFDDGGGGGGGDVMTRTSRRPKVKQFKANPVPLTSKIPLFDHIMEDQRRKSTLAKLNSAIELQARIRPFKFNGDKSSSRCLSRATSTPNLDMMGQRPGSSFKANPCPKNLFSNYFYNKMMEDDYFRALNRKIRAEEMLRISRLPPSMAKRNEHFQEEFSSFSGKPSYKNRCKKRRSKKSTTCSQRGSSNSNCSKRTTSAQSIASTSRETTPIPSYPVNRHNLAATLRVQSARQKVRELAKPKSIVPETRATMRASRSQYKEGGWGVRKSPAWRSMNYDPSNYEDIAVRLATRRAEQRLRQEEHEISMELMKQRVRAAPLLLEGPTYWGPKVGQLSHRCRSTENALGQRSITKSSSNRRTRRHSSKLSFYSVADTDPVSCIGAEDQEEEGEG